MKNIIIGIVAVGIIIFLVLNSKKDAGMNEFNEIENINNGENINEGEEVAVDSIINMNNAATVSRMIANPWIWEKTVMNDDTTILPNKVDAFSVTFTEDGNVSGTTDCNGFGGSYNVGLGNTITFGPFMSTLMFCEGSQEAVFSKNVSDSNMVFFTEEGNLVLLLPYDSGSVIFKK